MLTRVIIVTGKPAVKLNARSAGFTKGITDGDKGKSKGAIVQGGPTGHGKSRKYLKPKSGYAGAAGIKLMALIGGIVIHVITTGPGSTSTRGRLTEDW